MTTVPSESLQQLYKRPGFMLKRIHQVAMALFLEECKPFDITPSQYQALWGIRANPGIAQSALGRLIGQDRSTIALVVKLLVDRGLIRITMNSSDRRSVHLTIEDAGRQVLRQVEPAARRMQERLLAPLNKQERDVFLALITTLLDTHGALIDPAPAPTKPATRSSRRTSQASHGIR